MGCELCKLSRIHVGFDRSPPVYFVGETVRGRVTINVDSPLRITGTLLYSYFTIRTYSIQYCRGVQTILPKEPNYMGTKNSSIQNVYKTFGPRSQIWLRSHGLTTLQYCMCTCTYCTHSYAFFAIGISRKYVCYCILGYLYNVPLWLTGVSSLSLFC